MSKKVAVIISNYNGQAYLKDCFESLLAQTYQDFEIFLLDNDSSDGSVDFTAKSYPFVKIFAMDKNYGYAEGYNLAIAKLDHEYIALLNSDTRVACDWLKNLTRAIDTGAAIIGSKIFFLDQPQIINSAGQKLTLAGIFDIGFGSKDDEKFSKKKLVGSVCGASFLVRRDVFQKLGGFDNDYFLFYEDVDFCWRAWLSGYKVLYEPASLVFHKFGSSTGKRETPLRIFYLQRNAIITCVKNLGALRLCLSLTVIFLYTLYRLLVYLLKFKAKKIQALLSATNSSFLMIKTTLSKRRVIQNQRKISDKFLEENGLMASLAETFREYLRIKNLGVTT